MADRKVTIEISSKDLSSGVMEDIAKAARGLGGAFSEAHGHINIFGDGIVASAAKLGFTIGQLRELGHAVHDVAESFLGPAVEAEKVGAQLDAVLKSTAFAAGVERQEIEALSNALSKVTAFDDEVITSTQSMLLTFTNIGKDILPTATEAALNMATVLKEDTATAAIQLGKALNDPIAGVTALQRVGVKLTEQQKELVTQLVATGRGAEAQKIILQELETEFGNSARAAGDTFAGKLTILHTQLDNVREVIGGPVIQSLSDLLSALTPTIIGFAEGEDGAKAFADTLRDDVIPAVQDFWEDELKPLVEQLRDEAPGAIADAKVALGQLKEGFEIAAGAARGLGQGIDFVIGRTADLIVKAANLSSALGSAAQAAFAVPIVGAQNLGLLGRSTNAVNDPNSPFFGGGAAGGAAAAAQEPSAADLRAAQRAAVRANAWFWENSDDPEAVAWRASQVAGHTAKPPTFSTPKPSGGGGGGKGPKEDFLTAAEGFMAGLVSETANMEAMFGAQGGKLASALIEGISADIRQAGAAGNKVATALEAMLVQAEKAGVPGWRQLGDELAGALLASLQDGSPELRAGAMELIRSLDQAVRQAGFDKGMEEAGKKAATAFNVALEDTEIAINKIKADVETAIADMIAKAEQAKADQGLRNQILDEQNVSVTNLASQLKDQGIDRTRLREDQRSAQATARSIEDLEADHQRKLKEIRAKGGAGTEERLKAETDSFNIAMGNLKRQADRAAEDRKQLRADNDADRVYEAGQNEILNNAKLVFAGVVENRIRNEIEIPAFNRQVADMHEHARLEIEIKQGALKDIFDKQQALLDETETNLREKFKLAADAAFDGALEDSERIETIWGNISRYMQFVSGGTLGEPPEPDTDIPGAANGLSFRVGGSGGVDSQLVRFRATPGEEVRIGGEGGIDYDRLAAAAANHQVVVQMSGREVARIVRDELLRIKAEGLVNLGLA